MKKGITILICSFLLINSGLFILTYYSKLNQIKEHAKEKISLMTTNTRDGETILLKIRKKELSDITLYKEINDDEFIYRGNLYDVISREVSNDTVYIYCLHDLDEEDFQKSISSYFDSHSNHNSIFQTVTTGQAASLNFIKPHNSDLYPVQDENGIIQINFTNVMKGYFTISDPPPRFIS